MKKQLNNKNHKQLNNKKHKQLNNKKYKQLNNRKHKQLNNEIEYNNIGSWLAVTGWTNQQTKYKDHESNLFQQKLVT